MADILTFSGIDVGKLGTQALGGLIDLGKLWAADEIASHGSQALVPYFPPPSPAYQAPQPAAQPAPTPTPSGTPAPPAPGSGTGSVRTALIWIGGALGVVVGGILAWKIAS